MTCKSDSSLNVKKACLCNIGYSGVHECIRNHFKAELTILSNNTIKIKFNESLSTYLNESEVYVYISGNMISFNLSYNTMKSLTLKILYNTTITKSTQLVIRLPNQTTSIKNSLLYPTRYYIQLFEDNEAYLKQKLEREMKQAKEMAYNGASIGMITITGLSLFSWDPTTLFNFISTAELFYSSYLFDLTTYPVLEEFLIGLRLQSDIPNLFKYFIPSTTGIDLPLKYVKYGFYSNLSFLNVGYHFTLLAFLLILSTVLALIRCKWKKFLQFIIDKLKFGAFLRFWVQSNLEIFCSYGIGFRYSKLTNPVQICDFVLGIAFIVSHIQAFEFVGLSLCALVIWKRKDVQAKERIELFEKRFPVLFEEFKKDKWIKWIGSFIYVGRRVAFGLSLLFKLIDSIVHVICGT